ncbi:MAG: hypothetical protein PHF57_07990 [Methanoregula sp.]|nr:hypothetical protein [Methanoregula sp.]
MASRDSQIFKSGCCIVARIFIIEDRSDAVFVEHCFHVLLFVHLHSAGFFQPAESPVETWVDYILDRTWCSDYYSSNSPHRVPDGEPDEPEKM